MSLAAASYPARSPANKRAKGQQVCRAGFAGRGTTIALFPTPHPRTSLSTRDAVSGRSGSQGPDGGGVVLRLEDGGPGDEHVGPGFDRLRRVERLDAAIHLDEEGRTRLAAHATGVGDALL